MPPIDAYADGSNADDEPPPIPPEANAVYGSGPADAVARSRWTATAQRTWLVNHWLTYGITLLAGRGGIGKSMIAQTVGTALALGRPFIDEVTEPQTVLMWACEDDHDEVWRRQIAINDLLGCTMADIEGRFIVESRLGAANSMWTMPSARCRRAAALKEWHEQINDIGATVAILDNIAHAFGGNENDRHHVTSFVNGLASVTERPVATLLLGHVARSQGSEFAGSAAWENAARMRWLFDVGSRGEAGRRQDPEPDVRYLAKRKANYSTNDWRRFTWRGWGIRARTRSRPSRSTTPPRAARTTAPLCAVGAAQDRPSGLRRPPPPPARLPAETDRRHASSAEDYTQRELAEAMAACWLRAAEK